MTYEEIVLNVRDVFEFADARSIFVHIAVQVNIEGEGKGIFYIEVANRMICVEPYDYRDHDLLFITTGDVLDKVTHGELTFAKALETGEIRASGNMEKLEMLKNIKIKKYLKRQ